MSTTMLSASSAVRRNVASTTNVAPCSRCAGPNASPRRLWATITWSRTVMLNIGSALLIGDRVAERRQAAADEVLQHPRQLGECAGPGEQDVEDGVPQQVESESEAVPRRPAAPPRRC